MMFCVAVIDIYGLLPDRLPIFTPISSRCS
jgi:hypothetical protein